MIFPGHVAASVLCHRYLRADLRVALVAGVMPDLVDKMLYYAFHVTTGSRTAMHTLVAWLASTILVAAIEAMTQRGRRPRWWATFSWFVAYGAHLFCDSALFGGWLPFFYPLKAYTFSSKPIPLPFLFGLGDWPITTLVAEAVLVTCAIIVEWPRLRRTPLLRRMPLLRRLTTRSESEVTYRPGV